MLSGKYWPAHPHPLPGECLSSWLVRTAHANGLKVQTFCVRVFGNQNQVWNRDIDRQAPVWILESMSAKTGTPSKVANKTTLKLYEKRLFPAIKVSGQLRWVLPLKMNHRVYRGFGMQYCPLCLGEDNEPYFRLSWRLAIFTFCPKHKTLLHDKCWHCSAPVAFHRIELGKPDVFDISGLNECWACGESLTRAAALPVDIANQTSFNMWSRVLGAIQRDFVNCGPINYNRLTLLHQICKLLSSPHYSAKLTDYILLKSKIQPRTFDYPDFFESLPLEERQYILQMAWWLVGNTKMKINQAIKHGALNSSNLYRDSKEKCLLDFKTSFKFALDSKDF